MSGYRRWKAAALPRRGQRWTPPAAEAVPVDITLADAGQAADSWSSDQGATPTTLAEQGTAADTLTVAAVLAVNTFEGGSDETTITTANSGSTSGTAADATSTGAGATLAFDTAQAAHGSLACRIATGATATTSYFAWAAAIGTLGTHYGRAYLYFTANPGATHRLFTAVGTAAVRATVQLTTGGLLRSANAAGATLQTMTTAVALNQWIRVEWKIVGSATAGQVEIKLFNSAEATTPTETITSTAAENTGGTVDTYRFGIGSTVANIGPYWQDDLSIGIGGYLGPVTGDQTKTLTDSAAAAEQLLPAAAVTLFDSGAAADSLTVDTGAAAKTLTDSGTAADQLAPLSGSFYDSFNGYTSGNTVTNATFYNFGSFPFEGSSNGTANPSGLWEMDTGQLLANNTWGYSGTVAAGNGGSKFFFRLKPRGLSVAEQDVTWRHKTKAFEATQVGDADAVAVWMRYRTQYDLYEIVYDKRDNTLQAKRKVPCDLTSGTLFSSGDLSNKGVYYNVLTDTEDPHGAGLTFQTYTSLGLSNFAHDATDTGGTVYRMRATITTTGTNKLRLQLFRDGVLVGSWTDNQSNCQRSNGQTLAQDFANGLYAGVTGWQNEWANPITRPGTTGLRSDNIETYLDDFQVQPFPALTDQGQAAESTVVSVSLADSGLAGETLRPAAAASLSEAAAAADSLSVDQGATPKTLADSGTAVEVVTGRSSYDAEVLTDGPTAYWTMSSPGSGSESDQTGNGHTGTYTGTPTSRVLPNGDPVAAFNGVDQYLTAADHDAFSVPTTGRLTVEAWMSPDVRTFPDEEGTGYVHWIGKGSAGQHEWAGRMYGQDNTDVPFRENRISGYAFNASGGLGTGSYFQDPVHAPGEWIHYVLVINTADAGGSFPNGYTKIYKNGVLRDQDDLFDTAPVVPVNGTAPVTVATRATLTSFFQGAIGKVAIYPTELSSARVMAHRLVMTGGPGMYEEGFAADQPTVAAAVTLPDSGTAADSLTVNQGVPKTLPEAGTAADAVQVAVATPLPESGVGTDTVRPTATVTLTDSAAAADSVTVDQGVPKTLLEAGAAVDQVTVAAQVPTVDQGAGTDTVQVGAAVVLPDSGTAADSVTVGQDVPKTLNDTAATSDILRPVAAVAFLEVGTAADTTAGGVALVLTDSAAAADSLTVDAAAAKLLADTGTATDLLAVGQGHVLTDSAAGVEQLRVAVSVTVGDSALAADLVAVAATFRLLDTAAAADLLVATTVVYYLRTLSREPALATSSREQRR